VASMTWGKFDVHVCKTFFSRPFSQTSVHFLYRGYSFRCFLWKQALVGSAYGRRSYRKEQHILTPPIFFSLPIRFSTHLQMDRESSDGQNKGHVPIWLPS